LTTRQRRGRAISGQFLPDKNIFLENGLPVQKMVVSLHRFLRIIF
jgi:hypothetical protein